MFLNWSIISPATIQWGRLWKIHKRYYSWRSAYIFGYHFNGSQIYVW